MTSTGISERIERAIAGDADAQDALLRQFEGTVRAAIHHRLGDDVRQVVDTDDLVQSTMAAAIADIGHLSFRGEAAFRGWLLAIARHRVQMAGRHHRAQRRDVRRKRRLPTTFGGEGALTGPVERASRNDEADLVQRAVARLGPGDREIVHLRSFEGRRFDEIAVLLGLAGESSARQRFQRALRRLAIELDR